ncbi:MAG TPA: hypothetical protein VKU77_16630 [Streptosporangiaceae bacterium]|nr:hypothetical protein [Streptosporangiaceae bacterium]
MHGRGSWVIAVLVAGLAGCSAAASSSTGTASGATSPGPRASATAVVVPGHDTPEQAADGLIQAEQAGNQRLLCSYAVPSQQANCRGLQIFVTKGHISVVGALTSGDRALVEITGHTCWAGNGCQDSTNPSLGMPTGSLTFTQAYNKALTSDEFSPVPCLKVNGKWYVNFSTG